MRTTFHALLVASVTLAAGSLMAQSMNPGSGLGGTTGSPPNASNNKSNLNSGAAPAGAALPSGGVIGGSANGAGSVGSSGASSASLGAQSNSEIQVEGQLVDLITISHQVSSSAGAGVTSSNGGQVLQTPGLRVDASNMRGGATPSTPSPAASPSPTQAPDISASAGTYSRSGAAAGSSDASAGMSSSSNKMGNEAPAGIAGGVDPKRPASSTGTPGNTGNWAGNGPVGSTTSGTLNGGINLQSGGLVAGTNLSNNVRDELNAGVPPALVANGQAFVLVCDGKQLASMAGQTVRVIGRASGSLLIPDRIESRQADGSFKEIAFTKPLDTSSRTAQER